MVRVARRPAAAALAQVVPVVPAAAVSQVQAEPTMGLVSDRVATGRTAAGPEVQAEPATPWQVSPVVALAGAVHAGRVAVCRAPAATTR